MKIVVIGGTGLIGSKVVEKLKQKDHEAIAAAPSTGVNTITGEGLADVLAGAEVVVDVANSPSFEDRPSMDFFQTAGKNLTAAEMAAGVKHHVALSVVGTERLQESGYFRGAAQETGPGEHHQELADPLHAYPRHPVLRVPARDCPVFDLRRHGAPAARAVPADGGRRYFDSGRRGSSHGTGKRHGRDRRARHVHSGRSGAQGPRI